MRVTRNVKIDTKILSLVAVLPGLAALAAGFGIVKTRHIGEEIKEIAEEETDKMLSTIREHLELLVQMIGQHLGKASGPKDGNGNGKSAECVIDMVQVGDSGPDVLDEESERY